MGTAESGLHDLWHPSCSQSCFPILNISPSGHSGPGYFRNKGTVIAIAALVDSSLSLSGKRPLASHRVGSSYKVPYSLWGPLPSAGTEARPLRLLSVSRLAVPHFLSAWGGLTCKGRGRGQREPWTAGSAAHMAGSQGLAEPHRRPWGTSPAGTHSACLIVMALSPVFIFVLRDS